jgi:diguanylate cyclase (GGDEF)-like protein
VTGDVLVPVLITFLIVNVVLLARAWATGALVRPRPAASRPSPAPLAAERVAPEPVAPEPVAPEPVAPEPADGAAVPGPVEPEPADRDLAPALAVSARADGDSVQEPAAPEPAGPTTLTLATDHALLPGLDDEAAWDRRVADEAARLARYRRPVTIVCVDLDGLDRLRDVLGEEAGDRLTLAMADTLRRLARDTDHIAHLGNGRFAVLMPETPDAAAARFVERVRRACELWLDSAAVAVRLAIGWASTSGELDLAGVQQLAIERMHGGPTPAARRAETVAYPGPAGRGATRLPAPEAPSMATPRLSWETCRDPSCNHKEDHRRDRRR